MIFIDSSAFVSLVVERENFHPKAVQWWKNHKKTQFVTSNLVVVETLGWVRHHIGKDQSVTLGMYLFSGVDIEVKRLSQHDEITAWELFQKTEGRGVSMVDCTSFVLMKRMKIKEAFTFDQDLTKLGFTVVP